VGQDPEQLEREIERTRAKLGADIDALEEKVNPKKVAHRSVETAKGKAAELKDKVIEAAGTAKEKVVGATTEAKDKAAGVKDTATDSMSYSGGSNPADGSYPAGSSGPGLGEKVAGLAGTVKQKAAPLAQKAAPLAQKAGPLVQKAAPLAQSAKEKAAVRSGLDPATADTRTVATAFAGDTWATLQDQTRRNPVPVGAAALLLGYLLGR